MQDAAKARRKPAIRISKTDHERLSSLAETIADRNPDVSDALLAELDRARVVEDKSVPANTVRMGSTVTFTSDGADTRTVTLVFPGQANIEEGKVSILTPVGAALIGLSEGQSMSWTARDGREHALSVISVGQATPATNAPSAA